MLSDFQRQKLTTLFNLYDADRDKRVQGSDYERVIRNYGIHFGYAPGTPEYEEVHTRFMQTWEQMQGFDHDQDGIVNLDEFLAGHEAWLSQKEMFLAGMDALVGSFYEMVDHDKDGCVTEREFVLSLKSFGVAEADAQSAFEKLDRASRQTISKEEMVKNVEEFYLSDDAAAPGTWLVGPLSA